MDNDQIVSRMNSYLHTSANVLAEWLGSLLPRASDDWWEECVLDKLSYNQREMAIERGFTELGQFDLAALLRIADKSWYAMRNVAFLPTRERECVRDMMHCACHLYCRGNKKIALVCYGLRQPMGTTHTPSFGRR